MIFSYYSGVIILSSLLPPRHTLLFLGYTLLYLKYTLLFLKYTFRYTLLSLRYTLIYLRYTLIYLRYTLILVLLPFLLLVFVFDIFETCIPLWSDTSIQILIIELGLVALADHSEYPVLEIGRLSLQLESEHIVLQLTDEVSAALDLGNQVIGTQLFEHVVPEEHYLLGLGRAQRLAQGRGHHEVPREFLDLLILLAPTQKRLLVETVYSQFIHGLLRLPRGLFPLGGQLGHLGQPGE